MVTKVKSVDLSNKLVDLDGNSRLWIYQSERELSDDESNLVQINLNQFCAQWTSHRRDLKAEGVVLLRYFIVIALDEQGSSEASGCSIDAQVAFIKSLGAHLNVDFFGRDKFALLLNGEVTTVSMHDLGDMVSNGSIQSSDLVFDNLVKTLDQLKTNWLKPLESSWHSRFI